MIKVVAKSIVQADKVEEVIALYHELVALTRKEKGCIAYDLYQDTSNPAILTMIEAWESQADLDAHFKAEHVLRIVPVIKQYRVQTAELNVYQQVV
ncbi:MAG: putative quinol monooxygenase [Erysipelotrichaceae bacterium]